MAKDTSSSTLPLLYKNKMTLAPLVGGSDLSFRLLCRRYGAEVTYTEMCIADVFLKHYRNPGLEKTKGYVYEFDPSDRPLVLQLACHEPHSIIELANMDMFKGKIDALDINCGCPQGFAMERGIGAKLLEDPDHLVEMCAKIVAGVAYPVSTKIRLIKDLATTIDLIRRLFAVGIVAVTVHGRFQWQKGVYRGDNDWEAIRLMKAEFPDKWIIGNGDVKAFSDFERFRSHSGVDSVMAGYGALRKPSLFSAIDVPTAQMITDYISIAKKYQNKLIDVLRHIAWIVKGILTAEDREKLFQCNNLRDIRTIFLEQRPPIEIPMEVVTATPDSIAYPKSRDQMSKRELKKADRREDLQNKNRLRKQENGNKLKEGSVKATVTNLMTDRPNS